MDTRTVERRPEVVEPETKRLPAIELVAVSRRYATTNALDSVSFSVRPGEFVALLGPSGSGKTTTLMLVAGFETPTAGEVRINGTTVTHVPPHLRNIGIVFQSYALFPHLTVFENIAFPLKVRRVPRKDIARRVSTALDLVRLPAVGNRYPSQLSGGQQQRVAVARALVFGPSVLLMDEPLGALDRSLREEMQYELKSLQQELEVTVLYVTHDQGEAMAMADRIGVMKDGRLLQLDEPKTLYHRPADRFVASFIGECNFIQASASGRGVEVAGRVVADQAPGSAGEVELAVRPQAIHVSALEHDEAPKPSEVPAVVQTTTFLGSLTRIHLALDDGQTLVAVVEATDPVVAHLQPGDSVSIGWSEMSVYDLRSS